MYQGVRLERPLSIAPRLSDGDPCGRRAHADVLRVSSQCFAPATINLRLAAVRRLAYEASDNGLLNPDLAAGIRRVKGAKRLGMRLGNWLTADEGKKLLAVPGSESMRDKRDYAILSLLLGCGLRRAELTGLTLGHLQQRDGHWAIVNLYGKGGHIRTVPVPSWVKVALDRWLTAASTGTP